MKKLFFTAIVFAFTFLAFSSKASEFTLRVYDNSFFNLEFDENYFEDVDGRISFQNVSPGKHYLSVSVSRRMPNGHIIGFPKVIFKGMIHIKGGTTVYGLIDRFGRYRVEEEYVYGNPYHINTPPPVYVPPYMAEPDFVSLKRSIDNLSFESSKLTLAKQATASNILTSRQVYEIMDLFTFESTKLNFAKYAFPFVYDKNQYFVVNSTFTFSSSIDELDRFIAQAY